MRRIRRRHSRARHHTTSREVPLTPETRDALLEQRQAFIEKFGREPGPDEPVFFDPNADTPQPVDMG